MLIDDPIHRYVERESSYLNPSSCIVVKLFRDNKDLNQVVRMRPDERDILLNELKDMGYSNVVLLESKNTSAIKELKYTTALGWYDDYMVVYNYGMKFIEKFGEFTEVESIDLAEFEISESYENKFKEKWRSYRIAKYGWYKEKMENGSYRCTIV